VIAPTRPAWFADAACAGTDPDLMFPVEAKGPTVAAAKAVCASCPVRVDCLLHALNEGEEHGVWGGLNEHERQRVRLGRARIRPVTE
jgi:WhiB family transcriptional regulator, redox-sensing transcriptional regulator